ncbi:uncharacterized protein METZ01_LOCUS338416, partial [marine metagenome]
PNWHPVHGKSLCGKHDSGRRKNISNVDGLAHSTPKIACI